MDQGVGESESQNSLLSSTRNMTDDRRMSALEEGGGDLELVPPTRRRGRGPSNVSVSLQPVDAAGSPATPAGGARLSVAEVAEERNARHHAKAVNRHKRRSTAVAVSVMQRSPSGLHVHESTQVDGRELIGMLPSAQGYLADIGDDYNALAEAAGLDSDATARSLSFRGGTLLRQRRAHGTINYGTGGNRGGGGGSDSSRLQRAPSLASLRKIKNIRKQSQSKASLGGDGGGGGGGGDKLGRTASVGSLFDLTLSRSERRKIEDEEREKRGGGLDRWWWEVKLYIAKKKRERRDPNPVWRGAIREVEGRMGTGIAQFFVLMRWMLLLNVALSLVWAALVWIPELALGSSRATLYEVTRAVPVGTAGVVRNLTESVRPPFSVVDVFTGEGYIGTTIMFYAGYQRAAGGYHMDLAYFSAMALTFVLSMAAILFSMRAKFTRDHDTTSLVKKDDVFPYGVAVLASWDHSIENPNAQAVMSAGIANTLRAQLALDEHRAQRIPHSRLKRLVAVRLLTLFLTGCLLAACGYAIYHLIQWDIDTRRKEAADDLSSVEAQTYSLLIAASISLMNVVLPAIFRGFSYFEEWGSFGLETRVNVARAFFVKIASMFTVVISLWHVTKDEPLDEPYDCYRTWQNLVGSSMYTLLITDAVVVSFSTVAVNYGKLFFFQKCLGRTHTTKVDFDMPLNVLEMAYRQALIWMGASFAPMLPIIGVFSIILAFYVKKAVYLRCARLPQNYFSAHRSSNFFLGILMLTEIIILIPIGYIFTREGVACGPHEGLDSIVGVIDYYIATAPDGIRGILEYLVSMAFLFPLALFLGLIIFWQQARIDRVDWRVDELERRMALERADKRFLMNQLGIPISSSSST